MRVPGIQALHGVLYVDAKHLGVACSLRLSICLSIWLPIYLFFPNSEAMGSSALGFWSGGWSPSEWVPESERALQRVETVSGAGSGEGSGRVPERVSERVLQRVETVSGAGPGAGSGAGFRIGFRSRFRSGFPSG